MTQSGIPMPPSGTQTNSSSTAVDRASQTSKDGWNRHGNLTPDQALQNDKNVVRKPLDPASLKK